MFKIRHTMPNTMIAAHFAALLLIGQGAIAAGNDRVLYQDAQDYVKIVRQDERSIPNEHPFSIGEEEIISLLSPLTYKKKSFLGIGGGGREPIFERRQLERLSVYLSQGLKAANRYQDVVFAISGSKKKLMGSETLVTSGRIFISAGQLNIIFGYIDLDYDAYLDSKDHIAYIERGRSGENTAHYREVTAELTRAHPVEAGQRKSGRSKVEVSSNGGQLVSAKRKDWLMITLGERTVADKAAMEQIQQANDSVEQIRARHEGKFRDDSQYQSARQPVRQEFKDTKTLDERLEKLKELREKELIDDATYQKKLEDLMSEL